MKKYIKAFALLLALTLSLGLLSACGGGGNEEDSGSDTSDSTSGSIVKIGTPSATGVMGGVAGVAYEKGFFKEELEKLGYDVEVVGFAGAGPAVNEALIGQSIDFAVLADFPALTAKSKGVDTTLIAIENSLSNCAIAVSPDSDYQSIDDLVGKKIALPKGTYMQRFFVSLIEEKGYTESDFEIVQMTNDMESALVSSSVQAIIFTSDTINKCVYVNKTARIIVDTIDYPEYSGQSVVVGRTSFVTENPEVAEAIIRALISARDYAFENPEEANELLAQVGSSSVEAIENTYGFSDSNAETYYSFNLTDESLDKLNQTKSFLLEHDFISDDFDITDWYDSTYYDNVIG